MAETASANVMIRGSRDDKPSKCATLELFVKDPINCKNEQGSKMVQIPCWSGPGSPCINDKSFPGISVKDVYCDDNGYHETGFQGTETCDETKGRKFNVDFLKDQCNLGMLFISCVPGDCQPEGDAVIVDGLWSVVVEEEMEKGTALEV
ncbi:expressed unknown protein [Seminavis robusta]|uniref:Uncharacterized protein n=1 Tax=Seminavis robusta TaxID=568900 RepID=A0A9N8HDS5_9STRA|nr:expressed unknown protein [Seminavis robusta]|eukprot:Sro477_g150710.1 n/a (149) ;mRNA; f:15530-15976